MSARPDLYEDKVSIFVSLGTVTKVTNTESDIILRMAKWYD